METIRKLSKQMIVDKAFQYVDEYGLDQLSMRKLACILDVKAMSLYNHIKNKDELIDILVDSLVGEITFTEKNTWQETMKDRARSMREVLTRHAWGTKPLVSRWNVRKNFLQFFDFSLGCLVHTGFSYDEADQIISTLNSFVYGYVLKSLNFPIEEGDYQNAAEENKDFVDKDEHPHLWGLSNDIRLGSYSGVTDFELGLEFVIEGITMVYKEKKR